MPFYCPPPRNKKPHQHHSSDKKPGKHHPSSKHHPGSKHPAPQPPCSQVEYCEAPPRSMGKSSSTFTLHNSPCQVVELHALLTGYSTPVVVVRPWRHKQQVSSQAGFKLLPAGFPHRRESILQQHYHSSAYLIGGTHHGFLARAYARRHQHSPLHCTLNQSINTLFYFLLGQATRTTHHLLVGMLEQVLIACYCNLFFTYSHIPPHHKELTVMQLCPQAQRVVVNIVLHVFQLPVMSQDTVLIAIFPQRA